ncbi:MAG: RNA polymerase sigma factor [Cellulosilyticaceae bacterium]
MAVDDLIYQHKDQLYRLCLYLERQTFYAEELFQETWVKALEKLDTYDADQAFYPWLSKIAVNLYRDRLRRVKREIRTILWAGESSGYDCEDHKVNLEKDIVRQEQNSQLRACIGKLEDKYKLPLVLVYQEGLSYKEISQVLDIKESTIKSRIYDGKQKLKKLLEKEGLYE